MTATTPAGPGAQRTAAVPLLQNYVGGAWRDAVAAATAETRDPATGELLARVR